MLKPKFRNEMKPIIKDMKTKKPKNKNVVKTIKSLHGKDVYYLKADKGNKLVIMDKSDNENKMNELIRESKCIKIKTNPHKRMVNKSKELIKEVMVNFKCVKLNSAWTV